MPKEQLIKRVEEITGLKGKTTTNTLIFIATTNSKNKNDVFIQIDYVAKHKRYELMCGGVPFKWIIPLAKLFKEYYETN